MRAHLTPGEKSFFDEVSFPVVDTGWLRKEYRDRLLQCRGHGTPLLVDYPRLYHHDL